MNTRTRTLSASDIMRRQDDPEIAAFLAEAAAAELGSTVSDFLAGPANTSPRARVPLARRRWDRAQTGNTIKPRDIDRSWGEDGKNTHRGANAVDRVTPRTMAAHVANLRRMFGRPLGGILED